MLRTFQMSLVSVPGGVGSNSRGVTNCSVGLLAGICWEKSSWVVGAVITNDWCNTFGYKTFIC